MTGLSVTEMKQVILQQHYTHSIPSGKSWYIPFHDAIVVFSIPANRNISAWLIQEPNRVLELARLWAPDGHRQNLLTEAISYGCKWVKAELPQYTALVSYADPNVGHEGFIYRAASWVYLGDCEEGRYYRDTAGQVVSRRKFHSGSTGQTKAEILARGYTELRLPGKHRFAHGLTRGTRRLIDKLKTEIGQ